MITQTITDEWISAWKPLQSEDPKTVPKDLSLWEAFDRVKYSDYQRWDFMYDILLEDHPEVLDRIKQKFIEKHETEILERL